MASVLLWGVGDLKTDWLDAGLKDRLWHLTQLVLGGFFVYVGCIIALGIRPRHLRL